MRSFSLVSIDKRGAREGRRGPARGAQRRGVPIQTGGAGGGAARRPGFEKRALPGAHFQYSWVLSKASTSLLCTLQAAAVRGRGASGRPALNRQQRLILGFWRRRGRGRCRPIRQAPGGAAPAAHQPGTSSAGRCSWLPAGNGAAPRCRRRRQRRRPLRRRCWSPACSSQRQRARAGRPIAAGGSAGRGESQRQGGRRPGRMWSAPTSAASRALSRRDPIRRLKGDPNGGARRRRSCCLIEVRAASRALQGASQQGSSR